MHKSNKGSGSFDPVLSSLAGLCISYLQRATRSWTWEHRDCHALSGFPAGYPRETTKYTDRVGWGEEIQGKNAVRKGTQKDELQQNLPPFTRVKRYLGESGTQHSLKAVELRSTAAKSKSRSATCQLLSVWLHRLSIILTQRFSTVLLGQLSSRLRREVNGTVTTRSGTICRTQQHFWTCSSSGTLPVDLP